MRQMLAEASRAAPIYHPGPFWKPHADQMIAVVDRYGIENFRRAPEKAIGAFNTGNHWQPRTTRVVQLCKALTQVPGIGRIATAAIRDIETGYVRAKSEGNYKLRAVYYWLKDTAPDLLEISDNLVGNPVTFSIDGRDLSEAFILKLLELSLLRKHVDFSSIKSVVEVGGSYGLLGELILTRYLHTSYTLIDIAPVAAFAEYYLGHSFPNSTRVTIKCAHELPTVNGKFDLFINVASFQEMSREQVQLYCDFASSRAAWVYLNNNERSPANNMTTREYQNLLGMRVVATWPNPLHRNYMPTLLKGD